MRLTENIIQQLRDYLGGDFRLFDSNSGGDIELASKDRNVVVGVCYNTYGDYVAVREATAIESGMIIDFAIPIGATFDGYVEKIEAMSQDFNAQYNQVVYDNDGVQTAVVNYVLLFEVQKPTSNIIASLNNFRQTISVTIKITASPDMAFGNAAKVEIYNGGVWRQLENVIDATWTNTNENMPRVDLDSYQSTNESQYSTQKLVVTYFYKNSSVLHSLFEGHNVGGVNSQYTLRYTQNGETTTFLANTVNYSHQNPVGGFQPVVVEFVKAVTQEAVQNYTLTLSPSANSTITVTRYGIELSTGATIYSGDILTITAEVSTGYTLTSLKANNVSVVSGGNYTVTGNTTITTTVEQGSISTYILTLNEGAGTILTVSSGGTSLSSGSIIQQGQALTISAIGKTGFNVSTLTANGASVSSGSSMTVSDNLLVVSTGVLKTFDVGVNMTLPANVASNAARVRIYKAADYYGNAFNDLIVDSFGNLTATVNYGDVLRYTYDITTTGFLQNDSFQVNGITILNNGQSTIVTNVVVTAEFSKIPYTLHYSGNVFIFRNMVALLDGATIYYHDVLQVQVEVPTGYTLDNVNINGTLYETATPPLWTVKGNVTVTANIVSQIIYEDYEGGIYRLIKLPYGNATTILNGPTKTGMTFSYWNGNGERYDVGEQYTGANINMVPIGYKTTLYIRADVYKISASAGYGVRARAYNALSGGSLIAVTSNITVTISTAELGTKTITIPSGEYIGTTEALAETSAEIGSVSVTNVSPTSDSTYNYSY